MTEPDGLPDDDDLATEPEDDDPDGLPSLATGGVIRSPRMYLIGERGPECLVPLP